MLKYDIINDPEGVEKYFCKLFKSKPTVEFSLEERDFLLKLLVSNPKPFRSIPEKAKPKQIKIMENSILCRFTFKTDDSRIPLFLMYFGKSIGGGLMLLTMIQFEAKRNFRKQVDLEFICTNVFPSGFPNERDLDELWEAQKVEKPSGHTANLLDYQTALKSIQFL